MANNLDLEEQEQLDQLKHFWKQYGNPITWLLILVLGGFAAWNGYQYWQRSQSAQAAAMFDEVLRVIQTNEPDKAERAFSDMKERFPSAIQTHQAGLVAAKTLVDANQADKAKAVLTWMAEKPTDAGYASIARLRLAALLLESQSYDAALKQVDAVQDPAFSALAADRRGDILMAQGNRPQALAQYQKAYQAFPERTEYRRLVEVKLNALGVDPTALAQSSTAEVAK
ncbi:YfgM family protein [Rhodoferax sp.]|jgi:predicted negative regulator of RcsB-dependent stress response|uniref:YfgM family protein n=1 Tax=Rhodoferax sp. TaxID=50421 RepID=UPI003784CCA1